MNVARLAALLAALAVTAALAAAAPAGTVKLEQFAPTAADQSLAAAVGLRRTDLPATWRFALAKHPSPADALRCPNYAPDFSRFTVTGHAASTFTAGPQVVVSQVEVFPSAEEAAGDFALGSQPAAWACTRSTMQAELHQGAAGMPVSATSWKVTHSAPSLYEARGVFTIGSATARAEVLFDFVALRVGRGTVVLMVMTPAAKPIPEAAALARTLGARSHRL
jgi:hypothetical protein